MAHKKKPCHCGCDKKKKATKKKSTKPRVRRPRTLTEAHKMQKYSNPEITRKKKKS